MVSAGKHARSNVQMPSTLTLKSSGTYERPFFVLIKE